MSISGSKRQCELHFASVVYLYLGQQSKYSKTCRAVLTGRAEKVEHVDLLVYRQVVHTESPCKRALRTLLLNGCFDGCDFSYFLDTRQDSPCRRVNKNETRLDGAIVRTEL